MFRDAIRTALPIEVDPLVTAAVGDVARPRANVGLTRDLDHLPGQSAVWRAVPNLFGLSRHGVAHVARQLQRYGPVYRHMIGPSPSVFIGDADMLAEIARNEDKAWSAALAYRELFSGVVPHVQTLDFLTTFDFEPHRDVRKALQPAFSPAAIASYVEVAERVFESAIDAWLSRGRVRFKPEVRRLFAGVAGRIFMGIGDPREAKMLDRATADVWKVLTVLTKHPALSATWRDALRGYGTLHDALLPRVRERRNAGGSDLFSRLCQLSPESSLLDDEGLVRLFLGIMLAAFDTTSLGTTSMAYLLAKHPEWQERLSDEAKRVAQREAGHDGLKLLEQHEWVWKETLRLFPVAMSIPRVTLRDVDLGGYRIPARTLVFSMIGPVLRDPRFWSAPDHFDPERFAPDRAEDKRHRAAFLPFGSGAHTCIGMQLANVEMKVFWRALLSRARIRLARDYAARHECTPLGTVSGDVELVLERL